MCYPNSTQGNRFIRKFDVEFKRSKDFLEPFFVEDKSQIKSHIGRKQVQVGLLRSNVKIN